MIMIYAYVVIATVTRFRIVHTLRENIEILCDNVHNIYERNDMLG